MRGASSCSVNICWMNGWNKANTKELWAGKWQEMSIPLTTLWRRDLREETESMFSLAQHHQWLGWNTLLYLCIIMTFPSNIITFKKKQVTYFVARKTAQGLRAHAAFLENHFRAPTSINWQPPGIPAPGDPAPSGFHGHLHSYAALQLI